MAITNAASAVKLFAEQNITVRVPKLDGEGKEQRDDSNRIVTEDQALNAEHVIALREGDGQVFITVADGNKYSASAKAAK